MRVAGVDGRCLGRKVHVSELRIEVSIKQDIGRLHVPVQHHALAAAGRCFVQVDERTCCVTYDAKPLKKAQWRPLVVLLRCVAMPRRCRPRRAQPVETAQRGWRAGDPVVQVAADAQRIHEAHCALVDAVADERQQVLVAALAEQLYLAMEARGRGRPRAMPQPLHREAPFARQRAQLADASAEDLARAARAELRGLVKVECRLKEL